MVSVKETDTDAYLYVQFESRRKGYIDDMEFAFMIETIPGGSVPKCLSQDIWACEVSHAHALLAFLYAPTDTG